MNANGYPGNESGGHGGATAPSTLTLVSEILDALPTDGSAPPVLAAGGLATGGQVASYLTLGAAGAVLGTRFLLTPESPYSSAQKAALLAARSSSTVRTMAMDYARGTYGWPAGIDGRGIRNKIYEDIDAGVEHAVVQARFADAAKRGDPDYMVVWSGQGVSLMNEIKPAKVRHAFSSARCTTLRPWCALVVCYDAVTDFDARLPPQDVMAELHVDIVRALQRSRDLLQDQD